MEKKKVNGYRQNCLIAPILQNKQKKEIHTVMITEFSFPLGELTL